GRGTARAARREAATRSFCRSRIPPPRRSPRPGKGKTRRRGSRAACRTICSGLRREEAVARGRARSWRALFIRAATTFAIVGVGTTEHPSAAVIGHHFVEETFHRTAERAAAVMAIALERVIFEIERHDRRVRRDGINALFAAGAEQLQRRRVVHLRIVEF